VSENRNIELQVAIANMKRQVAVQIARKKGLAVPQSIVTDFDASVPVNETVDFFINNARPSGKRQRRKTEAGGSSGTSSNLDSGRDVNSPGPNLSTGESLLQGSARNSPGREHVRHARQRRIRNVLLVSAVLLLGLVAAGVYLWPNLANWF
jgi:hypothetical protein